MKRNILLALAILSMMAPVFALQVSVNPNPITATVTKSNPQVSFDATITLETNDSAVAVSVNSTGGSVAISGPTYVTASGTYHYTLVLPATPGTYTGTILFKATGSSNAQYQVAYNVGVTAWEKEYTDVFYIGHTYSVIVGSNTYNLKVQSKTDNSVTLYVDGTTYTIQKGNAQQINDDIKIGVDDIYSSGVVLSIYTQGQSVTVSDQTTQTSQSGSGQSALIPPKDLSGFHFLIAKYSKYIQQGMTYTVPVTLVNDTDYRVYLKDVYFVNTTVTPEGEKPTRLEDYQLPSFLDPGQELTLKVTIDTRGLDVGKTYTPSLIALGKIGDQDVRAQVDFYITVVKAVQTGETNSTKNTENNTKPKPTTPRVMSIQLIPDNPQPGDSVTVYVRDAKTQDYVNANITVNGNKTSSFTVDWCKTYRIVATADGYTPATKVVTAPCKSMSVTYSPKQPEEGDTVTFTVTDSQTGEPINNAIIRVDGMPITGTTWTAKAGTHTVSISAEGYTTKTFTISVSKPPVTVLSNIPTEITQNTEINISLSRPATWEIYDENGVLVKSGNGDKIQFAPNEPGTYTVKVEGKELASITVKPENKLNFGISGDWVWILAGVGLVLVVADSFRKKNKRGGSKGTADVGFYLRPKPAFTTPMPQNNNEGGNE